MTEAPLILFVCTGNVCRSPLAEQLTRHYLAADAKRIRIASAGLRALVGEEMDPDSARVLAKLGGQPAPHRARQLTEDMLGEAALVLTATRRQRGEVVAMTPDAVQRTFTVRQLGRILGATDPRANVPATGAPVSDLLEAVTSRRGLTSAASLDDDVSDPRGGTRRDQRRSADQQVPALRTIADFLSS